MFALDVIADYIMFAMCIFILLGSIFISFKMRFVQVRFLPSLAKMIWISLTNKHQKEGVNTILPYKALFTAMSTTLGIGTIVGPIIAIYWGGPGALLGFLLTAFFGSAATFTEVGLCIKYRKKLPDGEIQGGPMQYMRKILSPFAAQWYAFFGCVVMTAWSSAQANQLGAILDSPLLGAYRIPTYVSGGLIAVIVLVTLLGGIKRVSSFSSKLVPTMFTLYVGASAWILISHISELPAVFSLIFSSVFTPYAMASGALVGGIVSAMRWGMFKGTQATEAGVGTQTIPHSMAQTNDPVAQGMLAMVSTYTAGLVSFISGLVILLTGTWQDPEIPVGISMMASAFHQYFSYSGIAIVAISTFLFAFGTILGNSFNGSQCFGYLVDGKHVKYYYISMAVVIFVGTIMEVSLVWSLIDIALVFLVVPHMVALVIFAHKRSHELLSEQPEEALAHQEAPVSEPIV